VAALAVIAVLVLVVWSRPYDDALFRGAIGGGDWDEHLARVRIATSWQGRGNLPLSLWAATSDGIYPPFLHYVMATLGGVFGHGDAAVGRTMVLWLLLLSGSAGLVGWRISGVGRTGWLVAAATATVPGLAAASLTYFFDLPMTALLWLGVALLLLLRPRAPEVAGILAGLCWFAAGLTKWTALPFGVVMFAGALLVHLPGEGLNRGEVWVRLRTGAALAVVSGLLFRLWFGISVTSWQGMSQNSMGDSAAWSWTGLGGLSSWLDARLQPFSWERLAGYPADLTTSLLSPLLALGTLVLVAVWFAGGRRRGLTLIAATCLGQWAVLFWLVPVTDPRFLFTLLPALLLAATLGLDRLPKRAFLPVVIAWTVVALWASWDVHHGDAGLLNRYWSATPDRQHGFLSGRGLSIRSGDAKTGWRRSDDEGEVFPPSRAELWSTVAACGGSVLVVQQEVIRDTTDFTWWQYRNGLAQLRGEPAFVEVSQLQGWQDGGTPAVGVTLGAAPGPGWERVQRRDRGAIWRSDPSLCRP
jgi:hypothetical protein